MPRPQGDDAPPPHGPPGLNCPTTGSLAIMFHALAGDWLLGLGYPDYVGGTSLQRWHRELLRDAMEAEGFRVYAFEWWHFDFQGWERYRIQNATFEELGSARRGGR